VAGRPPQLKRPPLDGTYMTAAAAPTPITTPLWHSLLVATLGTVPITWLGWHPILAYWHFYHLGGPGVGLFLVYIGLPLGLSLSWAVIFFAMRASTKRGHSTARSLGFGLGIALAVWFTLLAAEIGRTTEARSGEGPGAGDLAPYLLHHFR